MEWVVIAVLLVLAIAINIKSLIGAAEIKQQRQNLIEENEATAQSMENFVEKLEKENDELYHKMVNYIKIKDKDLEEKLRKVEEKIKMLAAEKKPVIESEVREQLEEELSSSSDHEKISQLHKQGFSASQIAKVLQMERSKVELAINIYSRKKSHQN